MNVVDDVEDILRLFKETGRQFGAGNFEAALDFYAQDAVLMLPGAPAIHGNEAIRAELERTFAAARVTVALEVTDIRVSRERDMAYAFGTATSNPGDIRTKWLAVLAPRSGRWRVVADMFNSAR
jgi:ketosteroid isomerase-like protein